MKQDDRIQYDLLPFVQQPARYIGGEVNQIRKDWHNCDVHIALGMPEQYSIGSSSLALQIIYHIVNSIDGVLCERVFCPWPDAADRMRDVGIELFTLESHRPVRDFDILALSIPYEVLYSNLLEMLDLAGLAIRASDRNESDPLVLIGGSQAENPEPIADFIDMAILGDAEAALPAFLEAYRQLKSSHSPGQQMLRTLAGRFDWLYVPSLYNVSYHSTGAINTIKPAYPEPAMPVQRACTHDLQNAPFPISPIVPTAQAVHERLNIEIMRGCPNNCRFCQAGFTRRPVRFRSVEKIVELAKQAQKNTGLLEISLCSLSSADYPHLLQLTEELNKRFVPQHVSIALPSLRIDRQLQLVPLQTSKVRKGTMTIAVEAATERLRAVLGKDIDVEQLFPAVVQAYQAGWNHIKLYFMAGLPSETDEDLRAIGQFARRVSLLRKDIGLGPAQVTAAVAWLVPKPHTPFQWLGQADRQYMLHARQVILDSARSCKSVTVKCHHIERSILEAILSRGDRRLSTAIEHAWHAGARFDAWKEYFQLERYYDAFEVCGLDAAYYANHQYSNHQILPWQHIRAGRTLEQLWQQHQQAFDDS